MVWTIEQEKFSSVPMMWFQQYSLFSSAKQQDWSMILSFKNSIGLNYINTI